MKTLLTSILSIFGSTPKNDALIKQLAETEVAVAFAQKEFFEANTALAQAQNNFDNASPEFIFLAVEDLNIATHRADNANRKLRMELGLPIEREAKILSWLTSDKPSEEATVQ